MITIVAAIILIAVAVVAITMSNDDDGGTDITESAAESFTDSYDGSFGVYEIKESAQGSTVVSTANDVDKHPSSDIVFLKSDDVVNLFKNAKNELMSKISTMKSGDEAAFVEISGSDKFTEFYGMRCDVSEDSAEYTLVYFVAYVDDMLVDAYTSPQVHADGYALEYEVTLLVNAIADAVCIDDKVESADLVLLDPEFSALLYVYGNANNDGVIDSADVEFVENIVNGKVVWDKDANPLADVNNDGEITPEDAEAIRDIIGATTDSKVVVKNLNRYSKGDYWTETSYPIDSLAMTGSGNMFMMAKHVGIVDEIKAISYYGTIDPSLYPEYQKFFVDHDKAWDLSSSYEYRIGNSSTRIYKEVLTNHITKDGVTAVFSSDNATYLSGSKSSMSEKQIEENGVDVIRFKSASTDPAEYLSDLYMFAFLTGSDSDGIDLLASWYSDIIEELNSKLEAKVGVDINQKNIAVSSANKYIKSEDGTITNYNYISSNTSDYTSAVVAAGGHFALEDYDFKGSSSSSKMTDLGEWLVNYDIDELILIKTGSGFSWYGGTALTDGLDTLRSCAQAFTNTSMYYNGNIHIISGDMPIILRTLYAANILYSDVFGSDWVDENNKEYCTKFLGMSESDLEGGIWSVSMSDLGLKGH